MLGKTRNWTQGHFLMLHTYFRISLTLSPAGNYSLARMRRIEPKLRTKRYRVGPLERRLLNFRLDHFSYYATLLKVVYLAYWNHAHLLYLSALLSNHFPGGPATQRSETLHPKTEAQVGGAPQRAAGQSDRGASQPEEGAGADRARAQPRHA